MRFYLLLMLLLSTTPLLSKSSIAVNIFSKSNIPIDFKQTISYTLEKNYNYDVVDLVLTNEIGVISEKVKIDCRTKDCYVNIGEKIKSSFLMNIIIDSLVSTYSKKYKFKFTLVNLKTGVEEGKKLFYYNERLSNVTFLKSFSKKAVERFFLAIDKDKAKNEIEKINKIPKTLTKKDIISMVREVYPRVKSCGSKNKEKRVLKVHFKINRDGTASSFKFLSKINSSLENCLINVLSKMKTKQFRGDPIDITFPLKLD